MSIFSIEGVSISGIAVTVPREEKSNLDLEGFEASELLKLIKTIGIEKRREAVPGLTAADLCFHSAQYLLKRLNWKPSEVELLVFVSQTPDYLIPSTSMHLQHRLGLSETCNCFDLQQGCAGYVFGLSFVASMMASSQVKKAILLVGDTITQFIDEKDRSLGPIFSDAGSATCLQLDALAGKMHFNLESIGSKFDSIIARGSGSRQRNGEFSGLRPSLEMNGLEVFNFSLTRVLSNIQNLVNERGEGVESVDRFVFHQANKLILESLAKKLRIPIEKVPMSLEQYGNTSGVTIPLTIAHHFGKLGRVEGVRFLLCGFGVGLSIGSVILAINNLSVSEVLEYEKD